jgi:hypothetical protein
VHELLRTLSAEADGEPISESITRVTSSHAGSVADLIYRSRRLPIVAVSTDDRGEAQVDLGRLALRLSGAAHLIALDPAASWELTRLLDKRMSTFNGAARIYMPGVVEEEEDPYQHPLWLKPASGRNSRLIDVLAERVFPLGFRDGDQESRFWHLAQVRQAASAKRPPLKSTSEADHLRAESVALNHQINELKESLETAEALEKLAAANEKAALHDVEQLKSENDRLRAELYRFQHRSSGQSQPAARPIDRRLTSFHDLEDWADEVLGPRIIIHRKALKDSRQNGHLSMLERIESTLLAIRDHWIPHKLEGGLDRHEAAVAVLANFGGGGCTLLCATGESQREAGIFGQGWRCHASAI